MAFTYDISTERGKVRLLAVDFRDDGHLFEDAEIDAFLAMEDGVYRAAALALETAASDEALVTKKIETLEIKTDGPAVSKELRARAERLRKRADEIDANEEGPVFGVVQMGYNPFSWREILLHEAIEDAQ